MPIPAKPCDGRFSDELHVVLTQNKDRAQWAIHTCEVCGVAVGAVQVQGKWVPEQHWPTVKYQARKTVEKKRDGRNGAVAPQENAVLAESTSR
jgi:hypothetical protein